MLDLWCRLNDRLDKVKFWASALVMRREGVACLVGPIDHLFPHHLPPIIIKEKERGKEREKKFNFGCHGW
jgi:hypothetical protein